MDIWTFWPVSLTLIEVDRVQTAKEGVCVCVCVCVLPRGEKSCVKALNRYSKLKAAIFNFMQTYHPYGLFTQRLHLLGHAHTHTYIYIFGTSLGASSS